MLRKFLELLFYLTKRKQNLKVGVFISNNKKVHGWSLSQFVDS